MPHICEYYDSIYSFVDDLNVGYFVDPNMSEYEFAALSEELIYSTLFVSYTGEPKDWGLESIGVIIPGEDTYTVAHVDGHASLLKVAEGEISLYDIIEIDQVEWEESSANNQPETNSSSCANGCTSHKAGCDIKGNISYNSGEKIYHVPGQEYYSETNISPEYGERWFCTESEAIANGWRKSKE